jgi:hypothetical protein
LPGLHPYPPTPRGRIAPHLSAAAPLWGYGLDNDMSLDAFVGRQGSEGTIRLKCPKRIINTPGIPEKGYLTVHIKGYHRERVRYGVTGSSLRINFGAGFKDLFTDEGNRIIATFKLSENGLLELFYKEDEVSRYCLHKKSAKYVEGYGYCGRCQAFYLVEENNYRCPIHRIPLRTSSRKKKENGKR